ncbi:tetratricopeptide repeat protein [Caulobacter sp. ErkDOM-E]|uniref:O-linked N-acetylglucosamine transferase, SPINDLY family protein n=1 Tax=Caulobacter sp. ErkDOM-E TaxID=3402778 RepID=UPI003AF9E180
MTSTTPPIDLADPGANLREAVRLHRLGQIDAAESYYRAVLERLPAEPDSLHNLGLILQARGDFAGAMGLWKACVDQNPQRPGTYNAMGGLLARLGRLGDALAAHEQALVIAPEDVDALNSRGNLLVRLGRSLEALASYDRIIAIKPDYARAYLNRAGLLSMLGRSAEAVASCQSVLRLEPQNDAAQSLKFREQLKICDWSDYGSTAAALEQRILTGADVDLPHAMLAYCDDPEAQRICAEAHLRKRVQIPVQPLWSGEIYRHDKIRVAYVSSDFRNHPVAHLIAGLLERHDSERFEITAYALGPRLDDAYRQRIQTAFPTFHDVAQVSDLEVARMIRSAETDILVDLNGLTANCRPGIFAHRPAPIQINYLGHPGTLEKGLADYILADAIVAPRGADATFSEQLIRLPHSYQVNDDRKRIAGHTPSRDEAGLPGDGFVFACFNANHKINPPVFDVWMRLLSAVPGSVLWLLEGHEVMVRNLRAEAQARGVSPDRLVFAPKVALEDHLARHKLADLFLDTAPYNAHTTASDALWAGLPLVTCAGRGFAARVAASLLTALELPELVTERLEAYEALALDLARDPERLAALRDKLSTLIKTTPLFDTDLSRNHIEAAFIGAWERYQRGEPPAAFDVAP